MERDLALCQQKNRRGRTIRRLTGIMGVFIGILLIICYCAGCFDEALNFLKAPMQSAEQETGDETDMESDTGSLPGYGEDSEETALPETETDLDLSLLYQFDPTTFPGEGTPIRPVDLSMLQAGNAYTVNETGLVPGLLTSTVMKEYLLSSEQLSQGAPLVLIIHTHTTEAYAPAGALTCDTLSPGFARSNDPKHNVTAVGAVLADTLKSYGIPTVHCSASFDTPSCQGAYGRAEQMIASYLRTYPSIRYVIDIHRDSLTDSSGNVLRAVTAVNGETTAQVMCVVGTDENGTDCPWMSNYTLAQSLRCALNEMYGNLCRPTYVRASSYNQQCAAASFLLEIGTSGNSLEEAKRAAALVGKTLAVLLREDRQVILP